MSPPHETPRVVESQEEKGKRYAAFVEAIPPHVRQEIAANRLERAAQEHAAFRTAFTVHRCYLCGKPLNTFAVTQPCLHWLLKPNGFKKKSFPEVAKQFGVFQMQAYLRWVANEDAPGKNINDLPDEGSGKLLECTIRHQHLEWSFSCGESDLKEHATSAFAAHPHYHFQMRIDGKPFINFNDFHLPLSEPDVVQIEGMRVRPDVIQAAFPFGEGIREVLESKEAVEHILNAPSASTIEHEGDALIHVESLAVADEGTVIRGEDLYALIQEAKERGLRSRACCTSSRTLVRRLSSGPGISLERPASSVASKPFLASQPMTL